jgi:transposase
MPVVHPICCGIDVYQAQLTACLRRVDADRQVTQEVREFATTDDAVLTLSTWLTEQQCPVSALESTGVYWRPVYHVLVGTVEVRVGHAQEMRRRPGQKTDTADARWMVERLAHGLIRPSCIPPPPTEATRFGVLRGASGARKRRWPSPIKFW